MREWIFRLLRWAVLMGLCVTPLRAWAETEPPARTVVVPILMYHHVGAPAGRYHVPQTLFEWQMDYLGQNGFTALSIEQIAAALAGGPPLPAKPIAITFDDVTTAGDANAAVAIRGGYIQRSDEVYALRRVELNGTWSKARFVALVEAPFASPAPVAPQPLPESAAQPVP